MQTSTQISTFKFQEQNIRVVGINNNPWFIAKDVMRVLEVKNVPQALTRLEPEERSTIILNDSTEGNPETNIISESGFYTIVLSSRKPIAKPFKNWVTREVLPQLREHGYYEIKGNTPVITTVQSPSIQEQKDIILDSLITNLHVLKQTRQRLDQVEDITKLHTETLQEVEDIITLQSNALQDVEGTLDLQANILEELATTTSDRHSLVVDRLYSIEERLKLNKQDREPLSPFLANGALSAFNYINPQQSYRQVKNGASLTTLPAPTQQLPNITIETHLNNIVKSYVIKQQCQNNNITFQSAYNLLYKKFLDIFHINIKVRCEEHNRHYSPKLTVLKYAVKFDLIQDLYNTAYNLFITGNV